MSAALPQLAPAASAPRRPLSQRLRLAWDRGRRWEFWPAWLFYIPVVGYILWLGLRFGRPTAFTAANPAFEAGGVVGESKAAALLPLARNAPDLLAEFERLPAGTAVDARLAQVAAFAARMGGYPVVVKPDIGQRGRGVAIIRSAAEAQAYLRRADGSELLVQRYIGGEEFGVFIYRHPRSGRTVLYSITHKCFPAVTGDGRSRLEQLIQQDARARLIAPLLWQRFAQRLDEIPAAGERVALVEIGAHCRGSLFLDATALCAQGLQQAMTRVFEAIPGFHFGRLDLRCPSSAHLSRGEGLQVLEVNGVTAEAAHIYHPGTPLWRGYASILRQWRIAFEIGTANADAGAPVTGPLELLRRFREDLRRGADAP